MEQMPRGPKGEKRPGDVIGAAVMVGKIATGEIEDLTTEDGKNAAAVALGRMGGKARAEGMSAKRRKEIARRAAEKRWKDKGRE
ncbi:MULTISPECIES: RNA-binding protein [unclassified Bradyrhizobium]|uniref:RNA-binding protein n=1 Tax=unclassified Bradyrhizobium TaxID=2631580 RepID=UPI002915F070|nr:MULTISPECIES: RNA-binding protein [unclassified Bradyrhizobium]